MKPLLIKSLPNSLDVNFDPESGILELAGISMPENSKMFFSQLRDWIEEYVKTNPQQTTVNAKISYLNSGSHSYISELFNKLTPLKNSGSQIVINWYYESDDREMEEIGKDCSEASMIPFNMIPMAS